MTSALVRRFLRYLRIAFSATCLIACVLLIVLWVRSYWYGTLFNGASQVVRPLIYFIPARSIRRSRCFVTPDFMYSLGLRLLKCSTLWLYPRLCCSEPNCMQYWDSICGIVVLHRLSVLDSGDYISVAPAITPDSGFTLGSASALCLIATTLVAVLTWNHCLA